MVHLLRRNLLVTACLLMLAGTASADSKDAVVDRLTDHSSLSTSAAKKLVSKVNVRMAKAADATASSNDPMRAAVSLALFQAPQPPNNMAAAKVRLRLYAGLNEWSLEAIFSPQPGVIAGCVREVGATTSECEALVAAAAKSSVASIRSVAGGAAPSGFASQAAPAPASGFGGGAPAATGGSRFGRFSSGYQAPPQRYAPPQQYQAPPRYQQPSPAQQGYGGYQQPAQRYAPPRQQYQAAPRYPAQQQYGYPQQGYARPMPAAPPPRPTLSPQEAEARKAAYKARREAYIARQKAQFNSRKEKVAAVHAADAADAPPRAGEGADPLTPVNAAASAKPAPAAAAKGASADEGGDTPSEPVASKETTKPALDNDFLDGLLDDPLAKNKGKK